MAPTEQQLKQSKAEQLAGIKKAPKARVRRYLKRTTESKLKEGGKSTLLFQGLACSGNMMRILRELKSIQAPNSKLLSKKNNVLAFDSVGVGPKHSIASAAAGPPCHVDFLCTKNDCPLFAMATHNKKRPNNLIIGRTFNQQVLDMVELRIKYFKSMQDYNTTNTTETEIPKKRIGSKPLLLFVGDIWTTSTLLYSKLQNLLIDFYRGDVVDSIVASGVDHIIVFTAVAAPTNAATSTTTTSTTVMIHQRTYFVKLKKGDEATTTASSSSTIVPEPLLIPCGPDLDYTIGRTQWADDDTARAARKQPGRVKAKIDTQRQLKLKSKKNLSTNLFGETLGRLHVPKQNVDGRQTGRKMKSLRRAHQAAVGAEKELIDLDLQNEKTA